MIDLFNNFLGGAFLAFVLSNFINFLELGAIWSLITKINIITKKMEEMLREFKEEGTKDSWLK